MGKDLIELFAPLFSPRGVLVAGVSSHPGKFGYVTLHNILSSGYAGEVHGTNKEGGEVLGISLFKSVVDIPAEAVIDLVFVCTPAASNEQLLRDCAKRGIKAAFLTSAGYGEAGDEGEKAERQLVDLADELEILLAGPNGQGLVSTPIKLCAQIVAPNPPSGAIAIVSQSGNFVSSFENFSLAAQVGVSRAISAGNAASLSVSDYLDYYSVDPETRVSLAYVEGIPNGRDFYQRARQVTARKPLVVLKGGATDNGQRAAQSHTGALAQDDRIFRGMARQAGIAQAFSVEEAFDVSAAFATQPLPRGPRVMILTVVGGWGVVTADAMSDSDLVLADIPKDLEKIIDKKLPARWSRNNPIDCAGGETRDTIPEIMAIIADHPEVDAVLYLGIGIQSNQAKMFRTGPWGNDPDVTRIIAYHERQDARFALAAAEISEQTGKPILVATELSLTDPTNAGVKAVKDSGRYCFPSGPRAVVALNHLWRYSQYRKKSNRTK